MEPSLPPPSTAVPHCSDASTCNEEILQSLHLRLSESNECPGIHQEMTSCAMQCNAQYSGSRHKHPALATCAKSVNVATYLPLSSSVKIFSPTPVKLLAASNDRPVDPFEVFLFYCSAPASSETLHFQVAPRKSWCRKPEGGNQMLKWWSARLLCRE